MESSAASTDTLAPYPTDPWFPHPVSPPIQSPMLIFQLTNQTKSDSIVMFVIQSMIGVQFSLPHRVMALKKCKECSQRISSQAKVCPQCGHPQRSSAGFVVITVLVLGGIAVVRSPSLNILNNLENGFSSESISKLEKEFSQDSLADPQIAMYYLNPLGLSTGIYKKVDDLGEDRHLALSPYLEFGNNNLSFYCYGTRRRTDTLLVSLNANDFESRAEAVSRMEEGAAFLYKKMFGIEIPQEAVDAIRLPADYAKEIDGRHFVVDVIPNDSTDKYKLRVYISLERYPDL